MKLVEVAPISEKVAKESLTYFSSKDVQIGDIVTIEVRKKQYEALVINIENARDLKSDIKKASFGFKKILSVSGQAPLYTEFFLACAKTKEFFVGNLGQIISALIPKVIKENYSLLVKPNKRIVSSKSNTYALAKPLPERIEFYKKYISEKFKENTSVQIILPTIEEAKEFFELLKSDITNIFLFSSETKKTVEKYNAIVSAENSVLIISTPAYLCIPRHDLGSIIIEHESSSSYRAIKRPYFDVRIFARFLAEKLKINLIYASTHLSVETMYEVEEKNIQEILPINFDFKDTAKSRVIDMKEKTNLSKSYVFAKDSIELIRRGLEKKQHTFAFTLRKGLATSIICHDCKEPVTDDGAPVTLFLSGETGERVIRNAWTRKVLDQHMRCKNCESYNFDSLGIGTDTVYEETKKLFPKAHVFKIDSESTKTKKQVKETIKKFYATPGAILIGTELVIPYLREKIENSILVSFDSLLNIPSYQIYERMLRLLSSIIEKTSIYFFIQSRTLENPLLQAVKEKNLTTFYSEDLRMRKAFGWPPYSVVIKITNTGSEAEAIKIKTLFTEKLSDYKPTFRAIKKGRSIESVVLIKIKKDTWVDHKLSSLLSSLPPSFSIRLNPERLF